MGSVANGVFSPTSFTLGNGLQAVTGYDSMGRNTGNWLCQGSSSQGCSGGSTLYSNNASPVGQAVANSSDSALNQSQSQGYDAFNRLASVTAQTNNPGQPGSYTYTYDRYGNRWTQTPGTLGLSPSYSFNAANNQITTLPYDAAGNLLGDGIAHSFAYDAEGNIIQVDSGTTAQYVYDAFNRRVRVQTSSQSSEFLFDASGQRISTWSVATNTGTEGRIYADGQQIAFLSGTTAYLEQQNWLGTERLRTDSLGHVATTETSLAFGDGFTQSIFHSGSDLDNNQFAGQDYDAESSTQHAQFRQYSSTQGRWMSPDPYDGSYDFTNPQSLNRYAYALNNPLSLIDPSGLDEEGDDDSGGGDSGGAGSDSGGILACAPAPSFLDQLKALLGSIAGGIGSLFGGDPPLGSGSGPGAIGIVPQPAGIPMTLGYQNIARPAQPQGEGSPSNIQMRNDLANAAGSQWHSTKWNPKGGYSQCNVFVCDMLDKVGLNGPRNSNGHAITAAQWANRNYSIPHWRVLGANEPPAPGDVAAVAEPGVFANASGHAGIVSDVTDGVPYIVAAGSQHVGRTKASNFVPGFAVVYRRFIGQ